MASRRGRPARSARSGPCRQVVYDRRMRAPRNSRAASPVKPRLIEEKHTMRELSRLFLAATAWLCATAGAAPFAYVSNEGSGSISVIDTATDKVTAVFKAGAKPRGI